MSTPYEVEISKPLNCLLSSVLSDGDCPQGGRATENRSTTLELSRYATRSQRKVVKGALLLPSIPVTHI